MKTFLAMFACVALTCSLVYAAENYGTATTMQVEGEVLCMECHASFKCYTSADTYKVVFESRNVYISKEINKDRHPLREKAGEQE